MLDGVDDIGWAALDRPCHDPGDDIHGILRRLGSADIDTVQNAVNPSPTTSWYTAAITASSFGEWRTAVARCIETGSPAAIPALHDLATRDDRVVRGGYHHIIVWEDETLQSALSDAITQPSRST